MSDLISRQDTITEFKNYERDSTAPIDYVKIVEQMPPAQPDARYINANELIKRLQQAGLDDAVSIAVKMAGHERLKHVPSAQSDLKGAKCKIICSQRRTGRTTKLIEECARHKYALIVCPTRMRANSIFHDARKTGKNIPVPITFEDFIRGRFATEHINAFLIDDLDQCLAIYARNVPIDTVVFERREEPATSPLLTEKWKRQHVRGEQDE